MAESVLIWIFSAVAKSPANINRNLVPKEHCCKMKGKTMSKLMLDVDQAGELKAAFRRGGWSNAEIKQLCEGNNLSKVLEVLKGRAEIKYVEHLVDLGVEPLLSEGWEVEEHQKGKQAKLELKDENLYLDGNRLYFYLSKQQQRGRSIGGNTFLTEDLVNKNVINVNLLHYLRVNQYLIPESWKFDSYGNKRCIHFCGTIYRHSDGNLALPCLYWDSSKWEWSFSSLDSTFQSSDQAIVY